MIRVEIRGNGPVKVRLKLVKKVHEVLTHPLTILRIMGSIVKGQEVVKAHGSQAVAAVPPYPPYCSTLGGVGQERGWPSGEAASLVTPQQ